MEKVLNKRIRSFSEFADTLQTIIIYLVSLLTPLFLASLIKYIFGVESVITANSQIIVGSIVNVSLIIVALNLNKPADIIGAITMPSTAAILSGFILKGASMYVICMIPFIWIGNFALVYAYKYLLLTKNKNYVLSSVVGVVAKVLIISLGFFVFKALGLFSNTFINMIQVSMTTTQLITACIGSTLAYGVYKVEK